MRSIRLYHYAVFLRTSRGTVRRNVGITRRDVALAGSTARDAVQRHLRGQHIVILDVVPLRTREGKGERVIRPRARRPTTVRKVKFVLSRRPRARVSAILTKKGVRAYTPRADRESRAHEPVSARVSSALPKRPAPACSNKTCQRRGRCGHRRPLGVELHCHEAIIKVGSSEMVMRAFAVDERSARKAMRAELERMGLRHKRITNLAVNHAPDPLRARDGRLIAR